jgi:hypothetical protein
MDTTQLQFQQKHHLEPMQMLKTQLLLTISAITAETSARTTAITAEALARTMEMLPMQLQFWQKHQLELMQMSSKHSYWC